MAFDVILRYPQYDNSVSWAAIKWCEFVVGDPWDGWDCAPVAGEWEAELFRFSHLKHAEQFKATFDRKVRDTLVVSYQTYRYFWINQMGRDRLDTTFSEKGWEPQAVIPSNLTLHRKRRLDGGRVYFRRNVGWFFEREQDAMMFLLFDFDEGHD